MRQFIAFHVDVGQDFSGREESWRYVFDATGCQGHFQETWHDSKELVGEGEAFVVFDVQDLQTERVDILEEHHLVVGQVEEGQLGEVAQVRRGVHLQVAVTQGETFQRVVGFFEHVLTHVGYVRVLYDHGGEGEVAENAVGQVHDGDAVAFGARHGELPEGGGREPGLEDAFKLPAVHDVRTVQVELLRRGVLRAVARGDVVSHGAHLTVSSKSLEAQNHETDVREMLPHVCSVKSFWLVVVYTL